MSSSYVNTLGNQLVSASIGLRLKTALMSRANLFKFGMKGMLKQGQDTDTWRVEYTQELFDHNTYSNYPTPIVSRRLGTDGTSPAPQVATNASVDIQLGMYSDWVKLTKASTQMTAENLIKVWGDRVAEKAAADAMKLGFRTFNALDAVGGSTVRFANGVANESLVIAEIAIDDIAAAYTYMRDNAVAPITTIQDVNNNFNLVSVDECYVLIVHDDLETDIQANLSTDFIHKTQYVGKGFEAIDPSEIGYIPKYKTRVICSKFVQVAGDVAAASTAGRKQSASSVNNTYHNIMLGAEAFAIPGFGKEVDVNFQRKPGENMVIKKLQGIDFWKFMPEHSAADPAGLNLGIGYQFWMGDTSGGRGGILLPSLNAAGTTVYKCAKIITAASA